MWQWMRLIHLALEYDSMAGARVSAKTAKSVTMRATALCKNLSGYRELLLKEKNSIIIWINQVILTWMGELFFMSIYLSVAIEHAFHNLEFLPQVFTHSNVIISFLYADSNIL